MSIYKTFKYDQNLEKTLLEISEIHSPSFLVDLSAVKRKHAHWNSLFPSISPFYAVKCNPDQKIIATMAQLGLSFDCASFYEMSLVLGEGVPPDRIIFANPYKAVKDLLYAIDNGVYMMTFDCVEELTKIHDTFFRTQPVVLDKIQLILRVKLEKSNAKNDLNTKYGMKKEESLKVLNRIKKLSMRLTGLSFHVGNMCYDAQTYATALENTKYVIDQAAKLKMPPLKLFDIGGGFSGGPHGGFFREPKQQNDHNEKETKSVVKTSDCASIESISDVVNETKKSLFAEGFNFIAEPGRFFVESCQTLLVKIVSRQLEFKGNGSGEKELKKVNYVVNHGVFGAFKDSLLMGCEFIPKALNCEIGKESDPELQGVNLGLVRSAVYGLSIGEKKEICRDALLPLLPVNSFIYFVSMGAYTSSIASENMDAEVKYFYRHLDDC